MILGTQALREITHSHERRKCHALVCQEYHIVVEPLEDNAIRTNSIDVRLGRYLKISDSLVDGLPYYDYRKGNATYQTWDLAIGVVVLQPKQFILGTVHEYLSVPRRLSCKIEGRSSVGRFGLFIQNAGQVESGWSGNLTVELFNAENFPVILRWKMPLGHLMFYRVEGEVTSYSEFADSKYHLDYDPEPSKLWRTSK